MNSQTARMTARDFGTYVLSILIMAVMAVVAGCATGTGTAKKRVKSAETAWGIKSANALAFSGEGELFTVHSRAMMRGNTSLNNPEQTVATLKTAWGNLEIESPMHLARRTHDLLDLENSRWLDAAIASLNSLFSQPSTKSLTPIKLSVLYLPFEYQYDSTVQSSIGDGLHMRFVVGYDPSQTKLAPQYISDALQVIYHEILHATLAYSKRKPVDEINEEAAAVILGYCGIVEYANKLDASLTIALSLNNEELYLSRSDGTSLAPKREQLIGIDPSIAGDGLRNAALIAKFGDKFETSQEPAISELTLVCKTILEGHVPDIISGENI